MLRWFLALALLLPAVTSLQAADRHTLTVGVQSLRNTLDPAMALANAGFPLTNNSFDTLIRRDFGANEAGTSAKLVPGLATSWRRIDDLTLEVTLREGVTFHNGAAPTSADVKFTFERLLDPEAKYTRARFQLGNIDRVETPDDLTVRFVTKKPDPILEKMLAYPGSSIVPKDYFEQVGFDGFGRKPVGAGPYRVLEFVDNDRVVMEAFADYWDGAPPASRLTFREIPEVSARITALANGEVDIINSIPPDQLAAIERLNCCEVRDVLVNSHVLNYRTGHPAMADKRFRQGLNLAIDRELLTKALWDGRAMVTHSHQYEEWDELFNPARPKFAYDPAKAKALIEASDYAGQKLEFITHPVYYTNGLAAAQAIVEMWRKVGVNAEVRVDENWSSVSQKDSSIEVRNLSDWLIVPDPNATILWSWSITALWDGNEDFVRLGEDAATTLDPKVRFAKYQKMLDMFEDEAPGTVLYRAREFYGVRSQLKWRPFSVYMMDFRASNLSFE